MIKPQQVAFESIENQRVLLKVDLDDLYRLKTKVVQICQSIQALLDKKCSVCVLPSIGSAVMGAGRLSEEFIQVFEQELTTPIRFLSMPEQMGSVKPGIAYLLQNSFLSEKDALCDKTYISRLLEHIDIVVFDTLKHMDAYYASTWGLLQTGVKVSFGNRVLALRQCHQFMQRSKVGLVIGGDKVLWQCRLIRSMIPQLSFVALGGELALSCMGKGSSVSGYLYNDIVELLGLMRRHQVKVLYPVDVVAYSPVTQRSRVCLYQDLDPCEEVHDLGIQSIKRINAQVVNSDVDVVMFSGVLGSYQDPRYARGTEETLRYISNASAKKVLFGLEVSSIAERIGVVAKYDYVFEASSVEMLYWIGEKSVLENFSI